MNKKINCLVIEDQVPAQRILTRYIADVPHLKLVATFGDCLSAMSTLEENEIDLLFLDINLPKLSGLNFLKSLRNPPKTILTTAYPQYALDGFELDVLDYLLKPFSFDRFFKAINKLQLSNEKSSTTTPKEVEYLEQFVFVKSDKVLHRVDFQSIIYVQADGDFVRVVTTETKHFLSNTLKYWSSILPERHFLQVHRSYLVNISKIEYIRGNEIITKAGKVPVGRSFKNKLLETIEKIGS